MYDSTRPKQDEITLENILKRVNEYDIYASYIGNIKIGHIYNSPFRKDNNPSFGIYYSKRTGRLLFKDHGNGLCGDIIKFVREYRNLSNYNDVLQDIYKRLDLSSKTKRLTSTKVEGPKETVIGVVRQPFTENDLKYWEQFGITLPTLTKYNVNSIKYYLSDGVVRWEYKPNNPMFSYKIFNKFKIYRPYAEKHVKWRTNTTTDDIQGYEQLPKTGELLIITKSLKDVMVLYEMGYNAISPSSESTFISDIALNLLKKRFKKIIVLFDRDAPGMRYSRSISLKTGLNAIFVHKKFKSKDISDAVINNNFNTVKQWIDQTVG